MKTETYRSAWQDWSSGNFQTAEGLYDDDCTFESLGKSSTGKQIRTKNEHFSWCNDNNLKIHEMRLISASDQHMVWANRFTADGIDGVMAGLGHEEIDNGKIVKSIWCRAPAPQEK